MSSNICQNLSPSCLHPLTIVSVLSFLITNRIPCQLNGPSNGFLSRDKHQCPVELFLLLKNPFLLQTQWFLEAHSNIYGLCNPISHQAKALKGLDFTFPGDTEHHHSHNPLEKKCAQKWLASPAWTFLDPNRFLGFIEVVFLSLGLSPSSWARCWTVPEVGS